MAAILANTNITLDNTSAINIPGTPVAGQTVIYPKADKLLYYKDDAGVENLINVTVAPAVRQTVLSGPVDVNGFSAFVGATGSTTVTATGTLFASAAGGNANRSGTIVNPSWTGLSTNGSMFLFLNFTAAGVVTTASTTLAPTYRWGGADVTTNNQNTFNIQQMEMKVGDGATAAQVFRVFVGEVTVAGAVVTAITWYALMGRYTGAFVSTLPAASTNVSVNHNLGTAEFDSKVEIKCLTAEFNYAVGDVVEGFTNWRSGIGHLGVNLRKTRLLVSTTTADGGWQGQNATTNVAIAWTAANWAYRFTGQRRF